MNTPPPGGKTRGHARIPSRHHPHRLAPAHQHQLADHRRAIPAPARPPGARPSAPGPPVHPPRRRPVTGPARQTPEPGQRQARRLHPARQILADRQVRLPRRRPRLAAQPPAARAGNPGPACRGPRARPGRGGAHFAPALPHARHRPAADAGTCAAPPDTAQAQAGQTPAPAAPDRAQHLPLAHPAPASPAHPAHCRASPKIETRLTRAQPRLIYFDIEI